MSCRWLRGERLVVFSMLILLFLTVPSCVLASGTLSIEISGGERFPADHVAEFYIVTTYEDSGRVDADITNVQVYYEGKMVTDLTKHVEKIDAGFFWVRYVLRDEEEGTYTLLVEAKYTTNACTVNASAIKSFTVSNTLEDLKSQISSLRNEVNALKLDVDEILLNITEFSETLEGVEEFQGIILGRIVEIENKLGTINGSITNATALLEEINGTIKGDLISLNDEMNSNLNLLMSDLNNLQKDLESLKNVLSEVEAEVRRSTQQTTSNLASTINIVLIISVVAAIAAALAFIGIVELGMMLIDRFKL